MPTGPTGMTGPTGWAFMPITTDHSANVVDFPIGWTWTGANEAALGEHLTGTGKFGFRVYKNLATIVAGLDQDSVFNVRPRFRVVITNPTLVSDHTMPRLLIELRALSFAATNKLPDVGTPFFGSLFGGDSGTTLTRPVVTGIQYEPENPLDPSIWAISYTISARPRNPATARPTTGAKATKPNIEEAPWTIGPDVSIDFGTEDFVLGLGRFIASRTPAELDTALENDEYAEVFGATGGTFEMIRNSAGDPLESPPPMKVGTASIRISRAFLELPTNLSAYISAAREQVCSMVVTVNEVPFSAYTCKLNGATIANKRWKKQCDWLPKQLHPLDWTYAQVGWTPPTGSASTDKAVNYTRNALPAFEYVDYYEVSVSIAQRDLGWGYTLIDKGYRDKNGKENSFSSRQSYSNVLEDGLFINMAEGTTNKKVLRLYQVLNVGVSLDGLLGDMLG